MKLNFLKFKRNNLPSLKSLRPEIFNVDLFWFISLGLCLIIFIITTLIGFSLFYSLYSESYKQDISNTDFENLINIEKLKSVIEKRNQFVNKAVPSFKDPSLK